MDIPRPTHDPVPPACQQQLLRPLSVFA